MNKKGFTLVELLAVVVILAIVITIGFSSVNAIRNSSLEKLLDSKKNDIVGSAILYGQDHLDELTSSCTIDGVDYKYCKEMTVKELINSNYYTSNYTNSSASIDVLNDVTGYSMLCDTVMIYRKNNNTYARLTNIYSDSSDCCTNGSGC